jgi:membrane protein YdbS with pleckstrin-like domain
MSIIYQGSDPHVALARAVRLIKWLAFWGTLPAIGMIVMFYYVAGSWAAWLGIGILAVTLLIAGATIGVTVWGLKRAIAQGQVTRAED